MKLRDLGLAESGNEVLEGLGMRLEGTENETRREPDFHAADLRIRVLQTNLPSLITQLAYCNGLECTSNCNKALGRAGMGIEV